jgi:hypothetical protein
MQQRATLHAAHHEVHSVRADVANCQGGGRVDPGQLPLNGRLRVCRLRECSGGTVVSLSGLQRSQPENDRACVDSHGR